MRRASVRKGRAPFAVPAPDDGPRRDEIARLKAAVYGPHPPADAVARLAALREEGDLGAAAGRPESVARPPAGRRTARTAALLGGGAALAALACVPLASWTRSPSPVAPTPPAARVPASAEAGERAAVAQVVLDHPDELSARDWFTLEPADLPRPWTADDAVVARTGLVGARTVALPLHPATTRLLVFVLCSAPEAPYTWTVRLPDGTATPANAASSCRSLQGLTIAVPRGSSASRLAVEVADDVHWAVTVYER